MWAPCHGDDGNDTATRQLVVVAKCCSSCCGWLLLLLLRLLLMLQLLLLLRLVLQLWLRQWCGPSVHVHRHVYAVMSHTNVLVCM